jgi:putative transposase
LSRENHLNPRIIVSHINKTESVLPKGIQTDLLGISRSSLYYEPQPVSLATLTVMNGIDRTYTAHPFYGSRRIAKDLGVNRKQIQRLMREMGYEAIYPKPNLSKNTLPHPIYPYLLRGITAGHPNHIWGTDITYIRMTKGFLYLTAYLDWFSRFVLSWKLSTTLETGFVMEAAREALIIGTPEIENSDQGVQFTNQEYINLWEENKVKISMDGRGRAMDNIFTERLWRSLKYEEVYLKEYATVLEAKENIGTYFNFYNYERKHQSNNYRTPAEIYFGKEENLV